MRILIIADPVIPVPPRLYGGIERIIDMLCHSYSGLGHEIVLLAHPDSATAAEVVPLPGLSFSSKVDVAKNAMAIVRQTNRFRPDVVHSFGRLIQLMPLMPRRIPKVMSYQREPSLPGIRRAHRMSKSGTLLFTGCSNYISDQIASVANSVTVYNGIMLNRYEFRSDVADDAPLMFLGRLERIKGVHHAIRIAKTSGRRLVIAGNVPEERHHQKFFQEQVKPHLGGLIEYVGTVDDSQKNELLGRSLALVMAIEWHEPFGIVMAEALACGTPVLGTPLGAVPEVVADGQTGFLRPIEEIDSMVDRLAGIDRLACRRRCEQMFSDSVIASGYLQNYERMLGGKHDDCKQSR